jgi:hypothetical protein
MLPRHSGSALLLLLTRTIIGLTCGAVLLDEVLVLHQVCNPGGSRARRILHTLLLQLLHVVTEPTCGAVLLDEVLVLHQAAEQLLAGSAGAVRDNVLQTTTQTQQRCALLPRIPLRMRQAAGMNSMI